MEDVMARERLAEEFRQEALRQVVERGYSVTDVSKRLGYLLRAELSRATEERDILKKAAAYFARQSE